MVGLSPHHHEVTAQLLLVCEHVHVVVHGVKRNDYSQALATLKIEFVIEIHSHSAQMGTTLHLRGQDCLLVQCAHHYYTCFSQINEVYASQQQDDLLMIRKQFVRKKQPQIAKMGTNFDITFYRSSAVTQNVARELVQSSSNERKSHHQFSSRRKAHEKPKFPTQPAYFFPNEPESSESIYRLLTKDLEPSFLPLIDSDKRDYDSRKRNSEFSTSWIEKLKAKMEVKRIYAEESQRLADDLECWKRVKARTKLLKEIKQEKLRLIALYQKQ